MSQRPIRIAFAGNKAIAVKILKFILRQGVKPLALITTDKEKDSSWQILKKLCPDLKKELIFKNEQFRTKVAVRRLQDLNLDYIISVHFPFLFPETILSIPSHGILNLHPAYLPFNRGWHTATWAIINRSLFGATLHFMDKTIDTGDIIHQKKMPILPQDTGDSLYRRALALETQVFKEAWPSLKNFSYKRRPQTEKGSVHLKRDLIKIQPITYQPLLDQLRALTTSKPEDWSYFMIKNRKYCVKISIIPET